MGKDSNWGYMGHLTPEQKQMLAEFRKRVDAELPAKDWLAQDTQLLRFCRARNFNPSKTWEMLKEDVKWREPFEGYVYCRNRDFGGAYAMHEEGAIRLAGKAKDGRPVVMVQARYYWPKLVEDNIQIVYFFTFYVDAVCKMAEAVGQETFFAICDLEGFSMSNFSLSQMKIAISILQNHYPERLGRIFVINAPFVFTAAWRLIQPLLDERTKNKIEILGSNYLEMITRDIDRDQIEEPWGGTHAKWPIPDSIVQVAIDNETKLLDAEKQKLAAEAAPTVVAKSTTAAVAVAEPPLTASPVRTTSSNAGETKSLADAKKYVSMRKRVRKMVKKMLFISDNRAQAVSIGADPDGAETDSPKRLTVGGNPTATPTRLLKMKSEGQSINTEEEDGDVDPTTDLEKDILEVKEAHDKLLIKVEQLEKLVVAERKASLKSKKSLQMQVFLLALFVLVVMGVLIRERIIRFPSSIEL